MAQHILTMIGLTGLIIYRDPKLAFWACLVFPLAVYPVIYFGRKLRKNGRKMQAKVADVSSHLQESFNGLRVIKAFATEELEGPNSGTPWPSWSASGSRARYTTCSPRRSWN
jgi:subfamily B ATP-binding cassette protein MsbA